MEKTQFNFTAWVEEANDHERRIASVLGNLRDPLSLRLELAEMLRMNEINTRRETARIYVAAKRGRGLPNLGGVRLK
ncbi:MAG: hypothetical protein Q8L51_01445 [Candidatus Amesbacteria bacterium]|nr:hypothetical protein [Candidatus Amesbacteria bacterium]